MRSDAGRVDIAGGYEQDGWMRAARRSTRWLLAWGLLSLSWLLGAAALALAPGASGVQAQGMVLAYLAGCAAGIAATPCAWTAGLSRSVRTAAVVTVAAYVSLGVLVGVWLWVARPVFS